MKCQMLIRCHSFVPRVHTSSYYFAADINLNGTDTHRLVKPPDQEIFACLCVLLCVCSVSLLADVIVMQRCPLGSRRIHTSDFYAGWQSPERGHQGRGETTSFMAHADICMCHSVPGSVLLFSGCSIIKKIMTLKKQILKQAAAKWMRHLCKEIWIHH